MDRPAQAGVASGEAMVEWNKLDTGDPEGRAAVSCHFKAGTQI